MNAPCPPVAPRPGPLTQSQGSMSKSVPVPLRTTQTPVRAFGAPAATLGSIPPEGAWPVWASSAGSLDPAVPCHVPWHLGGACLLHHLPLSSPKFPPALLTLPSPVPGSPLLLLSQGSPPSSCRRANISPSRYTQGHGVMVVGRVTHIQASASTCPGLLGVRLSRDTWVGGRPWGRGPRQV